jgi:superfamily II DNA/RNA helicase
MLSVLKVLFSGNLLFSFSCFEKMGLGVGILNSIKKQGYETPTPIQATGKIILRL